jgi:hypothetical protein
MRATAPDLDPGIDLRGLYAAAQQLFAAKQGRSPGRDRGKS